MRKRFVITLAIALTLLALPQAVLAGVAGQSAPGEDNLGFLLTGAVLVWAGFFGYAFYVGRKNRELRQELDEIKRMLAERQAAERDAGGSQ
jgi:CcmD family protein